MPKKDTKTADFGLVLSEKDKVKLGIDNSSFRKRMQRRLNKIRGNDAEDDNESFLIRYNYYSYNERRA